MKTPKWLQVIATYKKLKNVSKTAKKHNINRATVYSYIKLYKEKYEN